MRATSFQDHPASAADRGCCACSIIKIQYGGRRPSSILGFYLLSRKRYKIAPFTIER